MTLIVAVKDPNTKEVIVAGDTQATGVSRHCKTVRSDPKVFSRKIGNDEFKIGFTSSYRMGQILMYNIEIPEIPDTVKHSDDLFGYMVKDFAETVRAGFKHYGFTKIDNGVESGGEFIVAVRGVIFEIESDFQVAWPDSDYAAVGSGGEAAMTILNYCKNKELEVDMRSLFAAVSEQNITVGKDFVFA